MSMLSDHLHNTAAAIRAGHPCTDAVLLDLAAREIEELKRIKAAPIFNAVGLTLRQRELMLYIQRSFDAVGIMPSFEEMMVHLGLGSKSGVQRLILGLQERGFIDRVPNRRRALSILKRVADKAEPAPATSHAVAEARKGDDAANPTLTASSPIESQAKATRDGADLPAKSAAAVGVASRTTGSVGSAAGGGSHCCSGLPVIVSLDGLTTDESEGAGDGISAPRTPVTSMISRDFANTDGLPVEGVSDLPCGLEWAGI